MLCFPELSLVFSSFTVRLGGLIVCFIQNGCFIQNFYTKWVFLVYAKWVLLITILLCDNSVCFSHSSIRKVFNAANQVKQNISQILQCFKAFLVTECVLFLGFSEFYLSFSFWMGFQN